ncbi:MAG: hypothetical protein ACOCTU_08050, partial [Bacteroidota bacterium]
MDDYDEWMTQFWATTFMFFLPEIEERFETKYIFERLVFTGIQTILKSLSAFMDFFPKKCTTRNIK